MFEYRATIVKVLDGNTVVADIDSGFDSWQRLAFRLKGVKAPKMGHPGGAAAREWLIERIPRGTHVRMKTFRRMAKNGPQYLATIEYANGLNLNEMMVEAGIATVRP